MAASTGSWVVTKNTTQRSNSRIGQVVWIGVQKILIEHHNSKGYASEKDEGLELHNTVDIAIYSRRDEAEQALEQWSTASEQIVAMVCFSLVNGTAHDLDILQARHEQAWNNTKRESEKLFERSAEKANARAKAKTKAKTTTKDTNQPQEGIIA